MGNIKRNNQKFENRILIALTAILSFIFSAGIQNAFAAEKGDILYSGGQTGIPLSWIRELPIGHTSIFIGTKHENGRIVIELVDSVPNYFKYGGIRKSNLRKFTHNFKYPYYGNRTTKQKPTKEQREDIVEAVLSKIGGDYNLSHLNQKGPKSYDCVGISEYAYESVGLNPTPDKLETGWGWPLTPAEQFENTVPNQPFFLPSSQASDIALQINHVNAISSQLFETKQNSMDSIEIDTGIMPVQAD